MAREIINIGTVANDGTGDAIRSAMVKVNNMTSELYTALGDGSLLNSYVAAAGTPTTTYLAVWDNTSEISGTDQLTFDIATGTLEVTGASGVDLSIVDENTGSTHNINTDGAGLVISSDTGSLSAGSFLAFDVDGGRAVYIDDQQFVGVGTATPTVELDVDGLIRTRNTIVINLPDPAVVGQGARSFVSDAVSTTFGDIAVGGDSNRMPVFSDGINWRIG